MPSRNSRPTAADRSPDSVPSAPLRRSPPALPRSLPGRLPQGAPAVRTSPFGSASADARNPSRWCTHHQSPAPLAIVDGFFLLCGAVSGAVSDLPPRSPQSLPPTDPASAAWPAAAAGSPAAPNTATSSERFPAPAHTPGLPAVRSSPQHKPLAERVHIAPLCTSLRYPTKRSSWDRFLRQISGGLFLLRQGPPLSRRSWPSFSPARTLGSRAVCVEEDSHIWNNAQWLNDGQE